MDERMTDYINSSEARTEKRLDELKNDLRTLDAKVDALTVSVGKLQPIRFIPVNPEGLVVR